MTDQRHDETGDRTDIRLCGAGGQGLGLAGLILADAAVLDGKNVVQTQSYGPEARGGASRTSVTISDGEIFSPFVARVDILLALTQESVDRYFYDLKENGILIVDRGLVTFVPTSKAVGCEFTKVCREKLGKVVGANIVALGTLVGLTHVVSPDSIRRAVENRAPKGTADYNLRALETGLAIASEHSLPCPSGRKSRSK